MNTLNRETIGKVLVLASLSLFYPAGLQAQTASEHFPNDDGAANVQVDGEMNLTLKVLGLEPVKTNAVGGVVLDTPPALTGDVVAVMAINKLCAAAVGIGLSCDGTIPAACAGLACCAAVAAAGGQSYTCDTVPGAAFGNGFTITRPFLATTFTVAPTPSGNKIQALNCTTNAGNTHGPDLLGMVLVQVQPNGFNGNVVFSVSHTQGGSNPRTFTVNTTGLTDLALHDAIRNGYNAMNLGLTARTRTYPVSSSPETFGVGNAVEILYSDATKATLQEFGVNGQRGQILTMETLDPAEFPAMSEWAMMLLIGLLLASGVWLLRRRLPRES